MERAAVQQSRLSVSKLLYIVAGGAIGAGLRYAASLVAFRFVGGSYPWGTLIVNVIGSFLAGFIWAMLDETTGQQRTNAFFFIGVLGAFTTFSAYALESMRLVQEGELGLAAANVLANNVGALLAVFAGFAIARWFLTTVR
ncbi:MAG TPA: fluoride efflux transporter CrcB [Bacteroidetes bacterium]|nr:fluoride efflux transporter CrcB [Bacteroidota bacterium]